MVEEIEQTHHTKGQASPFYINYAAPKSTIYLKQEICHNLLMVLIKLMSYTSIFATIQLAAIRYSFHRIETWRLFPCRKACSWITMSSL